ncbi:Calcium/proton exchanger [Mycena venus]|uniref:Vacuolar calcium ion transporter n=1 Tax=Mycena venus TaxID=2733690 RepID=A0A8H6Y1Y9_9AGAR|nr:Calcium/proton exchanger [Mycena venus]
MDLPSSQAPRNLAKRGNTLQLEAGTPVTAVFPESKRQSTSRLDPKANVVWYLWRKIDRSVRKIDEFSRSPFSHMRSVLKPANELGPVPGIVKSLKTIFLSSWLNLLLPCMGACWILHWTEPDQDAAIFATGFLAIIPLAKLLAFATDELSLRVGQSLAGLINATLGNVVELIVAIIALTQCDLELVQSSLIGSVLSNLLLVLGMCFFVGGVKFSEQGFAIGAAQLNSSLLILSAIAVVLPAAYHQVIPKASGLEFTAAADITQAQILKFSRGIALLMLFSYICFLIFQLGSHTEMYMDDSNDIVKSTAYKRKTPIESDKTQLQNMNVGSSEGTVEEDDTEHPQLNGWVCVGLLIVVGVFVAVTAEFFVDSINGLTASGPISKEFVGIILLPIAGNAAEHVSAVSVARKDKLTLSIGVAVGSAIQIALFVIPFIVTVAWMMGKPMTLLFDPFEAICLLLAVMTVNYVVQDGKSNWLEGMILMCLYGVLAIVFFFYPGMSPVDHFADCT